MIYLEVMEVVEETLEIMVELKAVVEMEDRVLDIMF